MWKSLALKLTFTRTCSKRSRLLGDPNQWLFLVPLIGGIGDIQNHPISSIYHLYTTCSPCQLGDYISPTSHLFSGNQVSLHWTKPENHRKLTRLAGRRTMNESMSLFYQRWFSSNRHISFFFGGIGVKNTQVGWSYIVKGISDIGMMFLLIPIIWLV